jgi:uncharacterized membrane protein YtjA (UPF0391 family)
MDPGARMLYWTVVFMVIAAVAGVFGFGDVANDAAPAARALCAVAISLFCVTLLGGAIRR